MDRRKFLAVVGPGGSYTAAVSSQSVSVSGDGPQPPSSSRPWVS